MGFLDSLFGNKKKIYQEALNSVDKVKVGLSNSLIHVCEYKFGKEYASSLISAIVNTIFSESPSSETGRLFLQNEDNINNVMLIIEKYIKPQENLMEGITEAVRVKCALSHSMNNNLSEPDFIRLCREPIDKLKRLGLLVSGGDMPDLPKFNQTAKVFFIVYGESIFPEIIFDQLSAQPIEERSVEHFLAEKMKFIESINRVNLPDHVPVKEESKMPNNPPKKVFVENNENPPFEYLKDNYSLDIDKYAEISDIIIDAATATSEQLEKESSYRASENLVHYFFDLYLSQASGLFNKDIDIASAIIDGIHFKYYGQPSHNVISSIPQLLVTKEKCFLRSFLTIFKGTDYVRYLGMFASFCISEDGIGAIEDLMLSKQILSLIEHVIPQIEKEISNIL